MFTILEGEPRVTYPNGGEEIYSGTEYDIEWVADFYNTTVVDIKYSLDNGESWLDLTTTANDGVYEWMLPSTPSTNALIKVTNYNEPNETDQSDAPFTIIPHITVISPNGGELLGGCASSYITWESGGVSGTYNIELSLDGGTTWSELANNVSGTSWNWPSTTNENSIEAVIRVSDAEDINKYDASDEFFEIAKTTDVVMVSPNEGEVWNAWDNHNITYIKSSNANNVNLSYSVDGGDSWTNIATNQSGGTYNWTVPNIPTTTALVRVQDQSVACRVDDSDMFFEIVSEVEVESPNGGEEYQATVTPFTSTGVYLMDNGSITTDGGRFFDSGGENGNYSDYSNYEKYFWPTVSSNELKMTFTQFYTHDSNDRLRVYDATTGQQLLDLYGNISQASLHSYPRVAQGQGLRVTFSSNYSYTAAGWDANIESVEMTYENVTHPITWDITGTSKEFNLDYSTNNGVTWNRILSNYYTLTGEYDWPVPNAPSEQCLIRVMDAENNSVVDVSNAVFTILEGEPNIRVLTPNTATTLYAGELYEVKWSSRFLNGNYVNINYSIDNGITWIEVDENIPNNGIYNWTVPNTTSTTCLIKIEDALDDNINDVSDIIFTISKAINLQTQNNADADYRSCTVTNIDWFNGGTSGFYDILYSLDNGDNWIIIENNYEDYSSYVNYNWQLPNEITSEGLIKVIDSEDPDKFDLGDENFTISPTIQLTSFSYGGVVSIYEEYEVTWIDTLTSNNYNLDYSTDNGDTWNSIIENHSTNTGMYTWQVPNNPSNNALMRVSDATNECKSASSIIPFNISHFSPSVIVSEPNGFEEYSVNEDFTISWQDESYNNNFNIEISYDAGSTWETIATNYYSEEREYIYQAGVVESDQCLIRVRNASNSNDFDISDFVFSINSQSECNYAICDESDMVCENIGDESWSFYLSGIYPQEVDVINAGEFVQLNYVLNISDYALDYLLDSINVSTFEITEVSGIPAGIISNIDLDILNSNEQICINLNGTTNHYGLYELAVSGVLIGENALGYVAVNISFTHEIQINPINNPVFGCIYDNASNFNPNAVFDSGDCIYYGCLDANACNFNPFANTEDNSCFYDCSIESNDCPEDLNGDGTINSSDLLLFLSVYGYTCDN